MTDNALEALRHALTHAGIGLPADGRVLFLRARDGVGWHAMPRSRWLHQQSFKPFADVLERSGLSVGEPESGARYPLILMLPPRQRDEARALFARASMFLESGGTVIAAMANAEGAKSGERDFRAVFGSAEVLSKHHCRVFWSTPQAAAVDASLVEEWMALDALVEIAEGAYFSRPGLFAWDRVDPASALLVSVLPASITGAVADLGAGYGYLGCEVLRRCPGVEVIDLYEAEGRALQAAHRNVARAMEARSKPARSEVIWHDVRTGLNRSYDAIVSNPPFHQGRADQPELGQAFIAAAAGALKPGGRFWLVANRHLPYEATLLSRFHHVVVRAEQAGFKVFEAEGVRS